MNTLEIKDSLEKDKSVNQDHTQFTSPETSSKRQGTSFVSQFESNSAPKKEKIRRLKSVLKMFMFIMVMQKQLRVLIFRFIKMKSLLLLGRQVVVSQPFYER